MIRKIWIVDKGQSVAVFHRNYEIEENGHSVDEQLSAGFFTAILQFAEETEGSSVVSLEMEDATLFYSGIKNYLLVLKVNRQTPEHIVRKALNALKSKFSEKMISDEKPDNDFKLISTDDFLPFTPICDRIVEQIKQQTTIKIVILGLDRAGKTTIAKHLIGERSKKSYKATSGVDVLDYVSERGDMIKLWDVAGQSTFRTLWPSFLRGASGVLFVVDSADEARIKEAQSLFEDSVLSLSLPFLILANKTDLPTSIEPTELAKGFAVEEHLIYPTCATKGEGVIEPVERLLKAFEGKAMVASELKPKTSLTPLEEQLEFSSTAASRLESLVKAFEKNIAMEVLEKEFELLTLKNMVNEIKGSVLSLGLIPPINRKKLGRKEKKRFSAQFESILDQLRQLIPPLLRIRKQILNFQLDLETTIEKVPVTQESLDNLVSMYFRGDETALGNLANKNERSEFLGLLSDLRAFADRFIIAIEVLRLLQSSWINGLDERLAYFADFAYNTKYPYFPAEIAKKLMKILGEKGKTTSYSILVQRLADIQEIERDLAIFWRKAPALKEWTIENEKSISQVLDKLLIIQKTPVGFYFQSIKEAQMAYKGVKGCLLSAESIIQHGITESAFLDFSSTLRATNDILFDVLLRIISQVQQEFDSFRVWANENPDVVFFSEIPVIIDPIPEISEKALEQSLEMLIIAGRWSSTTFKNVVTLYSEQRREFETCLELLSSIGIASFPGNDAYMEFDQQLNIIPKLQDIPRTIEILVKESSAALQTLLSIFNELYKQFKNQINNLARSTFLDLANFAFELPISLEDLTFQTLIKALIWLRERTHDLGLHFSREISRWFQEISAQLPHYPPRKHAEAEEDFKQQLHTLSEEIPAKLRATTATSELQETLNSLQKNIRSSLSNRSGLLWAEWSRYITEFRNKEIFSLITIDEVEWIQKELDNLQKHIEDQLQTLKYQLLRNVLSDLGKEKIIIERMLNKIEEILTITISTEKYLPKSITEDLLLEEKSSHRERIREQVVCWLQTESPEDLRLIESELKDYRSRIEDTLKQSAERSFQVVKLIGSTDSNIGNSLRIPSMDRLNTNELEDFHRKILETINNSIRANINLLKEAPLDRWQFSWINERLAEIEDAHTLGKKTQLIPELQKSLFQSLERITSFLLINSVGFSDQDQNSTIWELLQIILQALAVAEDFRVRTYEKVDMLLSESMNVMMTCSETSIPGIKRRGAMPMEMKISFEMAWNQSDKAQRIRDSLGLTTFRKISQELQSETLDILKTEKLLVVVETLAEETRSTQSSILSLVRDFTQQNFEDFRRGSSDANPTLKKLFLSAVKISGGN